MPRPQCPPVAADIIAEIGDKIILIERKNFPLGWAIPGGFVDFGETVEDAAGSGGGGGISLGGGILAPLRGFSRPARGPRGPQAKIVVSPDAGGGDRAA